jgi:acetate kinase
MATQAILSVNAGSSTVKFARYPLTPKGIGLADLKGVLEGDSFESELEQLVTQLTHQAAAPRILAVAHRVVHGGGHFTHCVRVDDAVLAILKTFNALAPLHQPHNLAGIERFRTLLPQVAQVACFDTAFHATLPELEKRFALPEALYELGVRRYGFHGLSYSYVRDQLALCSSRSQGRVLMAHLGNGASLCATRAGQSVATTMGFSTLDGLVMGTRCGALDPGVLLFLLEQGWSQERLENLLYRQSGLLGASGVSADMRTLRASADPRAERAIGLFTNRVVRETGGLVAVLGGLDVLVFSGGIGEHDARLRAAVADSLGYLGVKLDDARNLQATGDVLMAIHDPQSAVEVWVVPTDEGSVAAREAWELLATPD